MRKNVAVCLVIIISLLVVVPVCADALHNSNYYKTLTNQIKTLEDIIADFNTAIVYNNIIKADGYSYYEYLLYKQYLITYTELVKLAYSEGLIFVPASNGDNTEKVLEDIAYMIDYMDNIKKDMIEPIERKRASGALTTRQALLALEELGSQLMGLKLVG